MTRFNYGRAWTIAVHEYLTSVRQFGFIFFTLLPPAIGLIILIIAAFFSGQMSHFFDSQMVTITKPTGVVDQSG